MIQTSIWREQEEEVDLVDLVEAFADGHICDESNFNLGYGIICNRIWFWLS